MKILNKIYILTTMLLIIFFFASGSTATNSLRLTNTENGIIDNIIEDTNIINDSNLYNTDHESSDPLSVQDNNNAISSPIDYIPTNTTSPLDNLPESSLGLTNILHILLITVGIVLILLAIAIFFRLK